MWTRTGLGSRLGALVVVVGSWGCSFPTSEFQIREARPDTGVVDAGTGTDVAVAPDVPSIDAPTVDTPPTTDVVVGDDRVDAGVPADVDLSCGADVPCAAGTACCGGRCVQVQTDNANCGACGTACTAGRTCCGGACTEVATDARNCGACGSVCDFDHGTARCAAGACAGGTCEAGFGDCDGMASNGCEANLAESPQHCSMCGRACAAGANATSRCESMACVTTCEPGYDNCNGNAADGCEAQLSTSNANCGMCGRACTAGANAVAACSSGTCTITCAMGFADCDGSAANGCEVDLGASVFNCGACGAVCSRPNAIATCGGGSCPLAACNPGYGNCDGMVPNGCETNTNLSNSHCGGCGVVCAAGQVCANGLCRSTCATGTTLCAGSCVDLTSNATHCGTCGRVCVLANATAGCASSVCTVTACAAGFGNCDGMAANGCEVNTNTDPRNCGACGEVCNSANGTASCAAGRCSIACATGFADCNRDPDDGCETNTRTSVTNCGACGTTCSTPNATPACTSGACAVGTCGRDRADCDRSVANGCEVNTSIDALNCGACGTVCRTGTVCSDGVCQVTCSGRLTACSGRCVDLNSDEANCGACGRACTLGLVCRLGACTFPPPANDLCSGATEINLAAGSRIAVSGTLRGAAREVTPSCGALGTADVFYRLTLTRREVVYADTFGSTVDTKLFFMTSCTANAVSQTTGDSVCDDDRGLTCTGGTTGAQVFTVLNAGTYYLAVGLQTGATGTFSLQLEHLPVGSGRVAPLARGASTLSGTTSGTSGYSGSCGGTGPEATFWWASCPETAAGTFSASTCVGTSFDPVLNLLNGTGTGQTCSSTAIGGLCSANSAAITQPVVAGAGIHALIVDGFGGGLGNYSVNATRP